MKQEPNIIRALEDELSREEWHALLAAPAMRQKVELQLGMDALLRVSLGSDKPPRHPCNALPAALAWSMTRAALPCCRRTTNTPMPSQAM